MTFRPDWSLTLEERIIVALTLALPKHIPGYPGATDEQLEAVADEVMREVEDENASLRRERDDALRVADIVRDLATPPISDADVERAVAEAKRVRQKIEGEH